RAGAAQCAGGLHVHRADAQRGQLDLSRFRSPARGQRGTRLRLLRDRGGSRGGGDRVGDRDRGISQPGHAQHRGNQDDEALTVLPPMAFTECLSQASVADCLQRFFMTAPVDPASMAQGLWLIIALPLAGAVVNGVFGKALGRANTNLIACAAVGGSFLLSVLAFWTLNDPHVALSSAYRRDPLPPALAHHFATSV